MKIRHNKKRNTAFVYEALLREATVAILKKDSEKKQKILNLIREHFKENSLLKKDLELYRSLYENQNLDRATSEKIIKEAKLQRRLLNTQLLFTEQTELIHDINKELDSAVFNNFVPNYKTLATIEQIFSDKISPKNQVILENQIINNMINPQNYIENFEPVDDLLYRTFVKKFNDKYENDLLKEQKELLTYYISSFVDNALELKVFLNEEISRLKEALEKAKKINEIKEDSEMLLKTDKVINRLSNLSGTSLDENVLFSILKIQQLVKEISEDVSYN